MILALVAGIFAFTCALPSSASAFGPSDLDTEFWNIVDNPLNADLLDQSDGAGGIVSGTGLIGMADVYCGAMSVVCLGAGTLLVTAGAATAVWKSGFGSMVGSFLYNMGNPQTSAHLLSEIWCPIYQLAWGGPYGNITADSAGVISQCNTFAAGSFYQNPLVNEALGTPPYFDEVWKGSSCGFNPGGTTFPNTIFVTDPSAYVGSVSASASACMTDIYGDLYGTGVGQVVDIPNGHCISSGGCTSGQTCAGYAVSLLSASGTTTYSGDCYMVTMTELQYVNALGGTHLQTCGVTGFAACPTPTSGFSPGIASGDVTCGATATPCLPALNKLHTDTSGESATEPPVIQCVAAAGDCSGTGGGGSGTITLPRPNITETYQQYIARMRALGFYGNIYEEDDDMDYPTGSPAYALSPGLITEIQVTTAAPIDIYWPLPGHGLSGAPSSSPNAGQSSPSYSNWPSPSVNVGTDTITILKVPDSYVPAGGPPPPPGGCNCPPVAFGPLENLNYGSTFPFGAIGFLTSAISPFNGDTTGTPITFSLPLGTSSQTITLGSSSWVSTWRPIVFGILEFCMTLFAAVWFALRVIGHPGGEAEGTE